MWNVLGMLLFFVDGRFKGLFIVREREKADFVHSSLEPPQHGVSTESGVYFNNYFDMKPYSELLNFTLSITLFIS